MPIENGEYVQMSESEIIDALESEFRNEFGNDIDLTESSVFSTLASVLASVLSENQEQSLQDIYESGFLESATGRDLEKVVAIIGIQRRSAIHATGVQRFTSAQPVTRDRNIQRGTVVQTDSDDPIAYETTESITLPYIDGWESGALGSYAGDTGTETFSVVSDHPLEGNNELEAAATVGDHIYNEDYVIGEGAEFHFDVYPEADTTPIITFGVQDNSNYYQAVIDCSPADGSEELRIEKVENGSVSQTIASTAGLDIPEDEYLHASLDWNITGHVSLDVDGVASVGGEDSDSTRWREGYVGFKSGDANGAKYWDEATTKAASGNLRALTGGSHANVGSNSVTVMPSPPSGIDNTKNLYPIGDESYTDRNGEVFSVGTPRETDDELRERARQSVSSGGDATHDALVNELLNEVEGVTSVTIYENKSDNDNTGSGGLPPTSFEAVVSGGNSKAIAEAIFDKKAVTARDYSGANGSSVTETVTAESNGQQFDVAFSRPATLDLDITMDIVAGDDYIGSSALKDRIVDYIGGSRSDGTSAVGLGVGENVIIDEIEDIVTGYDETGVIGFNMDASDTEITTSPSKTTNENGIEVVSVGANEVAETDATDDSITINVTRV